MFLLNGWPVWILARGLAVIGMVFVNYVYVLSHDHIVLIEQNPSARADFSPLDLSIASVVLGGLAGRAAAVFLVLFGLGLMLQAKRYGFRKGPRWPGSIVKRYLLLVIGGLTFALMWDADILHFIGLFGLIALMMVRLRFRWLLLVIVAILGLAELLRFFFDYTIGWQEDGVGVFYREMWTIRGQLRQMVFNGYHPIFPWLSFVIYGMCLGRLDLKDRKILVRMVTGGVLLMAAGLIAQALGVPAEFFPAHSLFILLGMANASWLIAACLLVAANERFLSYLKDIINFGRLALSHYIGHVFLGVLPMLIITHDRMNLSFKSSGALALIYLVSTGILGRLWLRHRVQGPLERAIRLASNRPISL